MRAPLFVYAPWGYTPVKHIYRHNKGASMDASTASLFAAARRASGVTIDRAAEVCGVSRPTVVSRERDPGQYRLCELAALYAELDATGRELLMRGVVGAIEQK